MVSLTWISPETTNTSLLSELTPIRLCLFGTGLTRKKKVLFAVFSSWELRLTRTNTGLSLTLTRIMRLSVTVNLVSCSTPGPHKVANLRPTLLLLRLVTSLLRINSRFLTPRLSTSLEERLLLLVLKMVIFSFGTSLSLSLESVITTRRDLSRSSSSLSHLSTSWWLSMINISCAVTNKVASAFTISTSGSFLGSRTSTWARSRVFPSPALNLLLPPHKTLEDKRMPEINSLSNLLALSSSLLTAAPALCNSDLLSLRL